MARRKNGVPPFRRVRVLGYNGDKVGEFTLVLVPVNKDGSDRMVRSDANQNLYFTVVKKVSGGAGNLGAKNLARFLGMDAEFVQDAKDRLEALKNTRR